MKPKYLTLIHRKSWRNFRLLILLLLPTMLLFNVLMLDGGRHSVGTETFNEDLMPLRILENGIRSNLKNIKNDNEWRSFHGTKREAETRRPQSCNGCFRSEFPFLIDEPAVCNKSGAQNVDVIFLILTTHAANERRRAIRHTWASVTQNNTSNFRHVFLLGTTEDKERMREVREESDQFRDMLVSDFHDSYNNLTLKTLMGLRWAATRCRHARYFLKVDDDIFVNVNALATSINNISESLARGIGGFCKMKRNVHRDPLSKWYTPVEMYPYDLYPPYCSGTTYTGGMGVAERVVGVSKHVPFFHMEDVYVGMCLQAIGYGVRHVEGFLTRGTAIKDKCRMMRPDGIPMITVHRVPPERMTELWAGQCRRNDTN